MRMSKIRVILATAVVVGLAAPAALAGSLPKVPDGPGHQFRVKPASIAISGDGSFFFAGRRRPHHRPAPLKWRNWTATGGHGTGFNWVNNCKPDCADGRFTLYPVKLHVWRPRHVGGHFILTRMTVTYTGSHPRHTKKTGVYKVSHHNSFFFWSGT